MIYFYNNLKIQWVNFAIFGVCFMATPALADLNHLVVSDSEGVLNHPEFFKADESQTEDLRSNYFFSNSFGKDLIFEGEGDKLLPAANNTYTSTLSKRTERTSLRGKIKLDSYYFKSIFTDSSYILASPWRWDKLDWVTAAFVAGVTGTLFVFDDEITGDVEERASKAKSNFDSALDNIGDVFEPFGRGSLSFPALVGFYIYGRYKDNDKAERTALLAIESFLVTALFTRALKSMVGRQRPYSGEGSDIFKGPSLDKNSFPSGHTSSAFTIATVMANEYANVPLVAPISYSIAALTGFSRINGKNHWASDVFFGAALGYFTAKTILKLHSNKKGRHFTIYPQASNKGGGIIFLNRF
jgi:hypothetical protein